MRGLGSFGTAVSPLPLLNVAEWRKPPGVDPASLRYHPNTTTSNVIRPTRRRVMHRADELKPGVLPRCIVCQRVAAGRKTSGFT